ncbi:MAG: flagellar protein FlaG [Gammaproteobacteria bacterium]|nr:flagellar protein FlaG [Gammaproteobacteria bacterium]MCL5796964.1 flagellar protein FlaG [Gammaproteobacteria bacterium]
MKVDSLQTSVSVQARYEALNSSINAQGLNKPDAGSVVKSVSSDTVDTLSNVSSSNSNVLGVEKSRGLVQQANTLLKMNNSDIEFKVDDESGKAVFYLKDAASGEVLRQIPNEAMLRLSKNIEQFLEGASQLSGSKTQGAILSGLLTDKKV